MMENADSSDKVKIQIQVRVQNCKKQRSPYLPLGRGWTGSLGDRLILVCIRRMYRSHTVWEQITVWIIQYGNKLPLCQMA